MSARYFTAFLVYKLRAKEVAGAEILVNSNRSQELDRKNEKPRKA
jgi:hypothetical protein